MKTDLLLLKVAAVLLFTALFSLNAFSQQDSQEKAKLSFRDSLDNNLDLSDFVLKKKGFVPMPIIITEPALGGFGGGLAPVFIKPNIPREVSGKKVAVPPDITAVFGGYTLNGSWGTGGMRAATIKKWNLRYMLGAAYIDGNMDYYFNLDKLNKDVKSEFNIKAIPIFGSLSKQLKDPRFSIGLQYVYAHTELNMKDNLDGPFHARIDSMVSNYLSGDIGLLGIKLSYDGRDNTFTPDKGIRTYLTGNWSNPAFGSDYKYGAFEGAFYYYTPLLHNLITGTRFDMQQTVGNQPFYIKPFIDMRGVPSFRYQGKTTVLAELEERWDVTRRWSMVFFGGGGKAFDKYSDINEADWAWSYGSGFRYLMARKLKLRMGVDFAMGPEGFTYYLVFGSSWLRQ